MGFVTIPGFLALCCLLGYLLREKPIAALPTALGLWLLLLHGLAFLRALSAVDFLSLALLAAAALVFWRGRDAERKRFVLSALGESAALMTLTAFALLFVLLRGRLAGEWDEMGVWALETKNLFLLDGYSDAYRNVAVKYGDYFPGLMLFLWWAEHLGKGFSDGRLFVGYWVFFALYLTPLLERVRIRRRWAVPAGLLFGALLLILPSTADSSVYEFLAAELPMSALFGYLLWCLFDPAEHRPGFTALRFFSCLSTLMLLKNVGCVYALCLLALALLLKARRSGQAEGPARSLDALSYGRLLLCAALALLPALAWKLYCPLMGRSAYFNDAWENLKKGYDYLCYNFAVPFCTFPEFLPIMVKSFLRTLAAVPLHRTASVMLDLPAAAFVLLLGVWAYRAYRERLLSKAELKSLGLSFLLALAVFSLGLLFLLVFIFQEGSYADPSFMVTAISRYGLPLLLGALLFLLHLWLPERTDAGNSPPRAGALVLACAILLCSQPELVWKQTVDYRVVNALHRELQAQAEEAYDGLRAALNASALTDERVLYVYNGAWEDELLQKFVQVEQAPRSLCFENAVIARDEEAFLKELVEKYRPDYVYFREGTDCSGFAGLYDGQGALDGRLLRVGGDGALSDP